MVGGVTAQVALPTAPTPPAPRTEVEPVRPVERAASTAARADRDEVVYSPSKALLLLLRTSAQQFEEIIEMTGNATVAGTMTGWNTAAAGGHVDTYA